MPPLEEADHWNDAVYWKAQGAGPYGDFQVAEPKQLKVRWESVYKEVLTAEGASVAVTHVVHVSEDIALGSIFWEGRITDLPDSPNDLYEVVHFEKTPSLGDKFVNRAAFLQRFRDSLPDVV